MKKSLALVVLAGLMLTGCGGAKTAAQPAATATAAAEVVSAVSVPNVVGLTLDKATAQLEDLKFEVKAVDIVDGKSILSKKNWQVMSQDPAEGAFVAKGSTVKLGVKSLERMAEEKAAADKVAAESAAFEKAAADQAAAQAAAAKLAAEQAAAQQAAAAAAQQAPKPAPVAPAPAAPAPAPAPAVKAPASVSYANCAAVRAAGAAPIYAGTPGYGKHLDRDGDGVACEK
jgi:beta-lactam-binding protein with PASTA domain